MKASIKLTASFFLLITLTSCSSFVENLTKKSATLRPRVSGHGYCEERAAKAITVLGRDKLSVKSFMKFLASIPKKQQFNQIESVIAWSLFQMNQRPDLATPSARFQLLLSQSGKIRYWDFKDSALDNDITKSIHPMSFLYGLESILKTYSPKSSLFSVARRLDKYLPAKTLISQKFARFISVHKRELLQNKLFTKSFFKADEQLHYGESIKTISYFNLIKKYNRLKKNFVDQVSTSNELYDYSLPGTGPQNGQVHCNINIKNYKKNKYHIASDNRERHHPYAIRFPNGDFFLGITSISKSNFKTVLDSYLIESTQDNITPPLCYSQSKKGAHVYLSFEGRDPGQHLFNFFQYEIHKNSSREELDQYLKFPRHLLLKNPIRLLYESGRASKSNLESMLSKDIPVYHSKSLGEVWLLSPESGFVVDDRGNAYLSCMK